MAELRLDNFGRAKKNAEFVHRARSHRGKIQALAEMAVNRQDPDFLSSQVDSAAESMRQTEKAVSELQHLTGSPTSSKEPPAILETDLREVLRMTPETPRRPAELPDWFPPWASQLADLYFSGTTAAFVLHGNTYDLFRIGGDGERSRYGVLAEFLAEQLFGRWSLVLHYDLGRGLRAFAGRDEKRLKEMVALANKKVGDLSALPKDPAATFAMLDRFVRNNIMAPRTIASASR
jgi:hypothetical protein